MLGRGQGEATRTVSKTPLDSDPAVTCQAIILECDLGCNEVSNKFFLLGVNRDDGLASSLECLHFGIDVLELSVTVGMAGAFACFCIGLQTEAQTLQEAANQLLASVEAQVGQR